MKNLIMVFHLRAKGGSVTWRSAMRCGKGESIRAELRAEPKLTGLDIHETHKRENLSLSTAAVLLNTLKLLD